MELQGHLHSAAKSLFRFESLQDFDAAEEREAFEQWKESGSIDEAFMQRWWNFVESKKSEGVTMQRVRLVREPLTEYTRFELAVFRETIKHGDDIRLIRAATYHPLGLNLPDFWLVDGMTVLAMQYDSAGKYQGFTIPENNQPYTHAKRVLLQNSIPLSEFPS